MKYLAWQKVIAFVGPPHVKFPVEIYTTSVKIQLRSQDIAFWSSQILEDLKKYKKSEI